MPPASGDAPEPRPPSPLVARLAAALGIPPESLQGALERHGVKPDELLEAVQTRLDDARLAEVARSLHMSGERLAAAALEATAPAPAGPPLEERAAGIADGVASVVRGTAEEALGIVLEVLAESVPRIVNHILMVLALAGAAFLALGLLAILHTTLFVQILAVMAGIFLLGLGVGMFTLAWRLHDSVATIRILARVARRMRQRRQVHAAAARVEKVGP